MKFFQIAIGEAVFYGGEAVFMVKSYFHDGSAICMAEYLSQSTIESKDETDPD